MDNLLPPEIELNIFSRLPAESVLQCRKICKAWRTLLHHHPHFAQMHLHRSLQLDNVGILYLSGSYGDRVTKLYYGEYDENDEEPYQTLKRINLSLFNICHYIVGSCNGLICFSYKNMVKESTYLCNPITREYVNLPSIDIDMSSMVISNINCVVYGFGYLPSTNEYKVVRILFRRNINKPESWDFVGSVQVYTLGGGTGWRNKEKITGMLYGSGILANGTLNWLNHEENSILVFDLADEEFRSLPLPPNLVSDATGRYELKVLGGLLFFLHLKHGGRLDFWSLKKDSSTTYVTKEQEYQCWSWHKEFSMAWKGLIIPDTNVFAFTKSGEVLLWDKFGTYYQGRRNSILLHYNPKTATLRNQGTDMKFLQVIPHLNSFISLKALGEEIKYAGGLPEPEIPEVNSVVEYFSSTL